jgi:hypothetical protein
MEDLFSRKDILEYPKKVREIINLMTITRTYQVVGSASFKNIKYSSDIDLNETFKEVHNKKNILEKIYLMFKNKFKEIKKQKNIFITDFKCGVDSDGEPLRWKYIDMMRGYKTLANKDKEKFVDCILAPATMKMDIIALGDDGLYMDYSDNYFFKLGEHANFFPFDISRDYILNSLKHAFYDYYYAENNLMKGLKRCFSYYFIQDRVKNKNKLAKLMKFFNSKAGYLYKIKSELGTIKDVKKQTFNKVNPETITKNLEVIYSQILDAGLNKKFYSVDMDKLIENLNILINNFCLEFVKNNKDILLF